MLILSYFYDICETAKQERGKDPLMIDFTKIFQLKGLKPKNNGRTNFYECCDLTKKVYLMLCISNKRFFFKFDESFFSKF